MTTSNQQKVFEEKKEQYEQAKKRSERNPLSDKHQREANEAKESFFDVCVDLLSELLSD